MGQLTELFPPEPAPAPALASTDTPTCECQQCAADSHEDESTPCSADAEYSVTHSGFSCAECLAMMITMGLSMAEDDPEADEAEVLTVKVSAL